MEAENEFAVLYKKLIDGHFAPEPERARATLGSMLDRLPARGSCEPGEKPVESSESL